MRESTLIKINKNPIVLKCQHVVLEKGVPFLFNYLNISNRLIIIISFNTKIFILVLYLKKQEKKVGLFIHNFFFQFI